MLVELWNLTRDTYGGLPAVGLICLVQIALFGWVLAELLRTSREPAGTADPAVRRLRAMHRADIWKHRVRPLVMTCMLLGPGVGLAMSTLIGALGMGSLGNAIGGTLDQAALMSAIGGAYREISYAYLLMVGGTLPMLLGPVIVLLARRFEETETAAFGGDREDRMLFAIERILDVLEDHRAGTAKDAERTHRLLAELHTHGAHLKGAHQ